MGTPSDKMTLPANAASPHPATSIGEAAHKRHWLDHAARTTAVLAVMAAVSSGQYANQFSRTILAQAEASDAWSYYQAKSIKRHLTQAQSELLSALVVTNPASSTDLQKLRDRDDKDVKRYQQELDEAKANA